jgi:hypothetical protein
MKRIAKAVWGPVWPLRNGLGASAKEATAGAKGKKHRANPADLHGISADIYFTDAKVRSMSWP